MQAYCYAKLPRTGLGNQLLVWARAQVFAHLNNLPLLVSGWTHFHIGPLLRREKRPRFYWGYFKSDGTNPLKRLYVLTKYHAILEPELIAQVRDPERPELYVFDRIPPWQDFFGSIRDHRDLVREKLYLMLAHQCAQQLSELQKPIVGIHIRRGDFRELGPGEDFSKFGGVRTPLGYFRNLINLIREVHGSELRVSLFSDGYAAELSELLEIPGVEIASPHFDIVDLLLLSRSKILVASAHSTFSYWAAFLADAPVLLHPDHIHASIRPDRVNKLFFEGGVVGPVEGWPELLIQNTKAISGA